MNNQDIFKTFIEKCSQTLLQNNKVINLLKSKGIKESFIFENFKLGFVDDSVYKIIGDNKLILTKSCMETFQLIQAGFHNTTLIFGNDKKYIDLFINNNIKKAVITFEG